MNTDVPACGTFCPDGRPMQRLPDNTASPVVPVSGSRSLRHIIASGCTPSSVYARTHCKIIQSCELRTNLKDQLEDGEAGLAREGVSTRSLRRDKKRETSIDLPASRSVADRFQCMSSQVRQFPESSACYEGFPATEEANHRYLKTATFLITIILCAAAPESISAHQASIKACQDLARSDRMDGGDRWNASEVEIWNKTCRSEIADFSESEKPSIRAKFLETILLQICYRSRIGPRGIRIVGVRITDDEGELGVLDLKDSQFPWPVWLKKSEVRSVDLRRSTSDRDIILDGTIIDGDVMLDNATIAGQLAMNDVEVSKSASINQATIGKNLSIKKSNFRNLKLEYSTIGMGFTSQADQRDPESMPVVSTDILTTSILSGSRSGCAQDTIAQKHHKGLVMTGAVIDGQLSLKSAEVNGTLYLWDVQQSKAKIHLDQLRYDSIPVLNDCCRQCDGKDSNARSVDCTKPENFPWPTIASKLHSLLAPDSLPLIRWVGSSQEFTMQPYNQLASVFRSADSPLAADAILFSGKQREMSAAFLCSKEWSWSCFKLWLLELFTGYGIGIGSIVLFLLIIVLAVFGWLLTYCVKGIALLLLWLQKIAFIIANAVSSGALDEKIQQAKSLSNALKKIKEAPETEDRQKRIQYWKDQLSQNFLFQTWKTRRKRVPIAVIDWRLHATGVGLRNHWILGLFPKSFRPASARTEFESKENCILRPALLRWYFNLAWVLSAIIILSIVKGIAPLVLP